MRRLTFTLLGMLLTTTALAQDPPGGRGARGGARTVPAEAQKAAAEADALPPGAVARLGAAPRLTRTTTARGGSALVFSPDGRLVASVSNEVHLWDAATGQQVRTLSAQTAADDPRAAAGLIVAEPSGAIRPTVVAFAPDGKTIAARTTAQVAVWETATGRPVTAWRPATTVSTTTNGLNLAYTADGRALVGIVVSRPAAVRAAGAAAARAFTFHLAFWDPATGKELRQVAIGTSNATGTAASFAIAPDGRTAVAVLAGQPVQLIELASGHVRDELTLNGPAIPARSGRSPASQALRELASLRFAPDGRTLYNVGEDGAIVAHDLIAGSERRFGAAAISSPLHVSADGKWLAAWVSDASVRIFDTATGRLRQRIGDAGRGVGTAAPPFALSPDGATVAIDDGAGVRLIDVATGRDRHGTAGHTSAVMGLTFTPDGRTLVSTGADRAIAWDVARRTVLASRAADEERIVARAVSPDGARLAECTLDGHVTVVEIATGRVEREIAAGRRLSALALTPDGKTLVGADATLPALSLDPRPLRRWDLTTGAAQPPLDPGAASTQWLVFGPGGRLLIGTDTGGGVRVWDWPAGKLLWQLPTQGSRLSAAYAPALSPDGRKLALATGRGPVRIYDAVTGEPTGELEGNTGATLTAAFAPDGQTLATGGTDGLVRVWDVETGLALHTQTGHGGGSTVTTNVSALAYSPDGSLLASGGADKSILLWDATKLGRPLAHAAPPAPELTREQLDKYWNDLAGAGAKAAYRAVRALAASPAQSVPRLKELVHPVEKVDPARLAALLADLNHDQFTRRQRATEALAALGPTVKDALQQQRTSASAETRQRVDDLLRRIDRQELTADALRQLRAVEALERAATSEARATLEGLAQGQPGATLTREAEAALGRMGK